MNELLPYRFDTGALACVALHISILPGNKICRNRCSFCLCNRQTQYVFARRPELGHPSTHRDVCITARDHKKRMKNVSGTKLQVVLIPNMPMHAFACVSLHHMDAQQNKHFPFAIMHML